MAEVHEVYRQFVATPLKLRKKPMPSLSSSPRTDGDGSPDGFPRAELAPHSLANYSFSTPQKAVRTPQKTMPTPADLERLEVRIEVECRVEDGEPAHLEPPGSAAPAVPRKAAPPRRTSTRTRTKAVAMASIVPVATPALSPLTMSVAPQRKQKRVTRSEAVVNANTGGVYVDTPTKAAAPPKRSRKSTRQAPHKQQQQLDDVIEEVGEPYTSDVDKENFDVESVSITRNMMDAFADIDEALPDPDMLEKPKRSKKKPVARRQPAPRQATTKAEVPPVDAADKEDIDMEEPVSITRNMTNAFDDMDEEVKDYEVPEKPKNVKTKPAIRRQPATRQTRSKAPPRRDADVENVDMETVSITRNIMDAFADVGDELPDPKVREKPKKAKKKPTARKQPVAREINVKMSRPRVSAVKQLKSVQEPARRSRRLVRDKGDPVMLQDQQMAPTQDLRGIEQSATMEIVQPVETLSPPPAIDVEQAFCGPLLETKTTAGALFALWFNALGREVEQCPREEVDTLVEVLHALFAVCEGIGRCEAQARKQAETDDGFDDDQDAATSVVVKKATQKTVRFRHFDLSSLNLDYNDKTVPGFVEDLLRPLVDVVDQFAALANRRSHGLQSNMIAHIVGVLGNTDRLTERTKGDGLVANAFRLMSGFEQAEVRASQPFFNREFAKLVPSASPQSPFLESGLSQLSASLARFRLRELFFPYDPSELLKKGERLQIATYDHQDYGAAIHRALKEIYLYHELATPILGAITSSGMNSHDDAVKKKVQDHDLDDLILVERFMLASRYLRFSFRCILVDSREDKETAQLCERLEQLCALMIRLRFEDEAHLFPLTSIEEFVRTLERRESSFVALEKVLETVGLSHYDAEAPCIECNEIVTRDQQAEAISCCSCSGHFHLSCLHLPLSFAQFAGNYTCPHCFLGRHR